jgi:Amt family ammonium transporter
MFVLVEIVVDATKKVLYIGKIGNGKIFMYGLENVIRISTNEEGYMALQDE